MALLAISLAAAAVAAGRDVSMAARSNPFEGFSCAPAVPVSRCFAASGSVRRLAGRLDDYDVDLYVFLGTDRPSSAQLAAVDAELARLRL